MSRNASTAPRRRCAAGRGSRWEGAEGEEGRGSGGRGPPEDAAPLAPSAAAAAFPLLAPGAPGGGRGRRPCYVSDPFHRAALPLPPAQRGSAGAAGAPAAGRAPPLLGPRWGGAGLPAGEAPLRTRGCPHGEHGLAGLCSPHLPPHRPPSALLRGLPFL